MLFLLGEKVVRTTTDHGSFDCPICQSPQTALHVLDKNYFTVFFIRILPLKLIGDYLECSHCLHSYDPKDTSQPAYIPHLSMILSYLMLGYGVNESKLLAADIYQNMTNQESDEKELRNNIAALSEGKEIFETLKAASFRLNTMAKIRLVEAAYLMTRAMSDLSYEDRLRVNLIGNALDLSLEFINEIINRIQQVQ